MFFTSLLASKWIKPVLIGLAVIAIFVGLFWGAAHTIKTWEENIYNSAYAKAQGEALVAQNAKLAELTEKFSKASKAPAFGTGTTPVKTAGGITKLSKDAVQEAAKKYRK